VPPQQARVFMLREFMDFETDEICEQVGISSANVFVTLHRARQRLRECVDQRWFSAPATHSPTPAPTKAPRKGGRP
jgi:RNA polymerase sigma-70 factor (ECF subfamily)